MTAKDFTRRTCCVDDLVTRLVYDPRTDLTKIIWKDGSVEVHMGRLYNSVTKEPFPCDVGDVYWPDYVGKEVST